MKRLYLFLIIKYVCAVLFFAVAGVSCGKEDGPGKKEDGIKIENLETRLRIVESYESYSDLWDANVENILIYAPPYYSAYRGDTCFGYTDEKGEVTLCKVKNLSASVKDWNAELVHDTGFGIIREINVRLSGVVRLDTAGQAIKRGVLELTSLEPSGAGNKPTLQQGIYFSTYPRLETRLNVNFVNESDVIIPVLLPGKGEYDYAIREEKHTIVLKDPVSGKEWELFFRAVNDYEFELEHPTGSIVEYPRFKILTFRHIDKIYKNK